MTRIKSKTLTILLIAALVIAAFAGGMGPAAAKKDKGGGGGGNDNNHLKTVDENGNPKHKFSVGDKVYLKVTVTGLTPEKEYTVWIQPPPVNENQILGNDPDPSTSQEKFKTDKHGNYQGIIPIWDSAQPSSDKKKWKVIVDDGDETYNEPNDFKTEFKVESEGNGNNGKNGENEDNGENDNNNNSFSNNCSLNYVIGSNSGFDDVAEDFLIWQGDGHTRSGIIDVYDNGTYLFVKVTVGNASENAAKPYVAYGENDHDKKEDPGYGIINETDIRSDGVTFNISNSTEYKEYKFYYDNLRKHPEWNDDTVDAPRGNGTSSELFTRSPLWYGLTAPLPQGSSSGDSVNICVDMHISPQAEKPPGPIPELPTFVLVVAGLAGIFLLGRRGRFRSLN